MIDRKLLLKDFENTAARLERKGVLKNELLQIKSLMEERNQLEQTVNDCKAEINKLSKEIGLALNKNQESDKTDQLKKKVVGLKENNVSAQDQLSLIENDIENRLLHIPNIPSDDAPIGMTEDENVIVRYEGYEEDKFNAFTYKPHWEIAEKLGILDQERASKLSGSMFAILRKSGARLLHALIQFGMQLNREKHEEIVAPHFVKTDVFQGTGHLPKFAHDAYKIENEELWVVPTGEVALTSLHRGEILSFDELPKRYMTYSSCFRREAGSHGKDTRGMQRLHEFHKVELVRLCAPEQVQSEFEDLLADAEKPLKILGLPYRVLDLCAGDLTFSSTRIFDLEVYAPGADTWLEVSSVGIFSDFQTRRGNTRFRREQGKKPEFVHALNGSGLATPRVWAAIIENFQQADGTVLIPEPLRDYMGTDVIKP
ncbi:MAG: serine--tRNA ligase [Thermodesulfobacteriota bacterium]|nr:serine--tRNA ligase [Thermodesulfobacteriota bacterium]